MIKQQPFPPYLLGLVRKYRVSNATLAAVLRIDRTTVSKKLNSKRSVRFSEVESICKFLNKIHGAEVDISRVMKG